MRELKFRAWDCDNKWMERDFWIGANGIVFGEPARHFDTPNTEIQEDPNLITMQFTGLKDKNGVEIYIGDVLNKNNHDWAVVDCFEFGSVKMNRIGVEGSSSNPRLTRWQAETSAVVGNIYENPELLKSRN